MDKPRFKLSGIRLRILIITISTVVCISIAILFAGYQTVSKNLLINLIQTSETKVSFLCNSINSNISNVKTFINTCKANRKIMSFAMENLTNSSRVKRDAHDIVFENYKANKGISQNLVRVVILGTERDDIIQIVEATNSSTSVSAESITSLPYFDKLTQNKESVGILSDPFFTTKKVSMIPMAESIYHPFEDKVIGYVFTELSTNAITDPIRENIHEPNTDLYFRIDSHLYKYNNNALEPCRDSFTLIDNMDAYALDNKTEIRRMFNNETSEIVFLISRPLEISGWYITECVSTDIFLHSVQKSFKNMLILILAAGVIITITLYLFLYKTVTVPVSKLQKRIKKIENGDFSRDPSTEWNHELGDIGRTINNLSETVQDMVVQRVEDEKKKNEYEYKMLQSQINPHFLYNTLNSIKWMATIQNAPGIAEMTTALSRLMKSVSKGTKNTISIKRELELVKDYFTIQKYRYGGIITLNIINDEPELLSCEILKFSLQPIVENAIFHGIEPKGTAGTITIHIYSDEAKDVHIDITDDGIGMDDETMFKVLNEPGDSAVFFKEIGISNVNKRLQYNYGDKYGLFIKSEVGEYTTITVLLPNIKCEDEI